MTDREQIIAAAKACGVFERGEWFDTTYEPVFVVGNKPFNPLANSADCAAMCAKLGIETAWESDSVVCSTYRFMVAEFFKDHNNDREAAWRYAATRVAAKIGGMK